MKSFKMKCFIVCLFSLFCFVGSVSAAERTGVLSSGVSQKVKAPSKKTVKAAKPKSSVVLKKKLASVQEQYQNAAFAKLDPESKSLWFSYNKRTQALAVRDMPMVRPVVVAVVDTGFNASSPEFAGSLWSNPGEAQDGVDNDGNGYVDDVHGLNFVEGEGLDDQNGHGSNVAGLIGAAHNGVGIEGVAAGRVQLMNLKVLDKDRSGVTTSVKKAVEYAVAQKADIINVSLITKVNDVDLEAAVKAASDAGVVVVSAAGNFHTNIDMTQMFPANYVGTNLVNAVSISSETGLLSDFSNFGVVSADFAADGDGVAGPDANGGIIYMAGTSQSAALISGQLALVGSIIGGSPSSWLMLAKESAEQTKKVYCRYGFMRLDRIISKAGFTLPYSVSVSSVSNIPQTKPVKKPKAKPVKNPKTKPVKKPKKKKTRKNKLVKKN